MEKNSSSSIYFQSEILTFYFLSLWSITDLFFMFLFFQLALLAMSQVSKKCVILKSVEQNS